MRYLVPHSFTAEFLVVCQICHVKNELANITNHLQKVLYCCFGARGAHVCYCLGSLTTFGFNPCCVNMWPTYSTSVLEIFYFFRLSLEIDLSSTCLRFSLCSVSVFAQIKMSSVTTFIFQNGIHLGYENISSGLHPEG